jgi:hypothetical protein
MLSLFTLFVVILLLSDWSSPLSLSTISTYASSSPLSLFTIAQLFALITFPPLNVITLHPLRRYYFRTGVFEHFGFPLVVDVCGLIPQNLSVREHVDLLCCSSSLAFSCHSKKGSGQQLLVGVASVYVKWFDCNVHSRQGLLSSLIGW